MDGPGMSLLNGVGSIHINRSIDRAEEEEALEEERKRKEEIQNKLNEGLSDFEDDEGDTMDESGHFTSMHSTRGKKDKVSINLHDELLQSDKRGNAHIPSGLGDGGKALHQNQHNGCLPGPSSSSHFQHCYQSPTTGAVYENFHQPLLNPEFHSSRQNEEQLRLILEIKIKEEQKLKEELAKCKEEALAEHDKLYGRLAIAEAERDRAQLSLHQSEELVENSKHRIGDLEQEILFMNKKIMTLNVKNEDLAAEVQAVTASLMDTQNRLQIAQLNKESAQNTDALFKALHERHAEDIERLDKNLMKARKMLDEKEREYSLLEKRYQDLEHTKDTLLIEKGATINQLAMELKDTQDGRLQLISERNASRLQCEDLAHKFEETAKQLVEYRTKFVRLQEEQSELDEVIAAFDSCEEISLVMKLNADKPARRFSAHADKIELLHNEFTKRMKMFALKDEQIEKLNKIVQQKDNLLQQRMENEERLKLEVEGLKARESMAMEELKHLTNKLEASKSSNLDAVSTYRNKCLELEASLKQAKSDYNSLLTKHTSLELKYEELFGQVNDRNSHSNSLKDKDWLVEKEKLMYQLKDSQNQAEKFKNHYIELCGERDRLLKEIKEFQSSDVYHELKIEKTEVGNLKNLLEEEKKKVEKFQKALLDIQKSEFENHLQNFKKSMDKISVDGKGQSLDEINLLKSEKEFLQQSLEEQKRIVNELTKELEDYKNTVTKIRIENELQAERDRLIADLKEKGKQFEKYIENQKNKFMSRKDVSTSTDDSTSVSEAVQTSIRHEENKNQINPNIEEMIREEIASQYAVEIKKIENQYLNKSSSLEEEYKNNVIKLTDILKVKSREVTSLQEVILTERNRFKDFIEELTECKKIISNNEKILAEYKTNIGKYKQHIRELNNQIEVFNNKQKHTVDDDKWKETALELDKLKEKYKMLKKCALKYKEYNAEKDKHIEKELEKVKNVYEEKIKKMNEKVQNYIKEVDAKIKNSNSMESIKSGKNSQRREAS